MDLVDDHRSSSKLIDLFEERLFFLITTSYCIDQLFHWFEPIIVTHDRSLIEVINLGYKDILNDCIVQYVHS